MLCSTPVKDQFTHTHDGYRAMLLRTLSEALTVETALTQAQVPYRTRIVRSKKHGLVYVVMLVGVAV